MACFGLVNGGYSSVVAWLAPFYQERGWSAAASGSLLAALTVCQAGAALLLPVLARKHEDRRPWLWLTLVLQAAGFAALAWQPDAAPIAWPCCWGAGLGGCFALSLIVALDHLPDPLRAGVLSSYVQGGGFLIAAAPPWIVAALRRPPGAFATAGCCIWPASPSSPRCDLQGRAVQLCEGDGRAAADAARAAPAVPEVIAGGAASRRDASCTGHMPGLCCGSTGASVLAVSIDGYVRLFLPWLTFEARAAQFLTRCLLLVAALAARGQAARPRTRRACTSSTSSAAAGRALRASPPAPDIPGCTTTGWSRAGARAGGGALHGGIGAAADAGRFGLAGALRLAGHVHARRRGGARRGRPRRWRRAAAYGSCRPPCARCFAATRMCAGQLPRGGRLWFGDSGQVRRVRLLDSGFARARPAADAAAGTIETGRGRAAGRGQPITFVIRPGQAATRLSCITAERGCVPPGPSRSAMPGTGPEGRRPGFVAKSLVTL